MINHGRTLLLNIAGDGCGGNLGDEYLPPAYRPLGLPTVLQIIRSYLFGSSPDRIMLNYRAQQLLAMLHATPLAQFLTALDPRITYDPYDTTFFDPTNFAVSAQALNGNQPLSFIGAVGAPDALGQCQQQWLVEVLNEQTVSVIRRTAPISESILEYTPSHSLSSLVPLPGSGLQFRFPLGVGQRWRVSAVARPVRQLGDIVAALKQIGEANMIELFGVGSPRAEAEPWRTFYNLWLQHPELPYALGGVVLGLIYYMDEIRTGVLSNE